MYTGEKRACVLALQGNTMSVSKGLNNLSSLNREFSTEVSFLKKTCLLQIMHGSDNTGPAGHRN